MKYTDKYQRNVYVVTDTKTDPMDGIFEDGPFETLNEAKEYVKKEDPKGEYAWDIYKISVEPEWSV